MNDKQKARNLIAWLRKFDRPASEKRSGAQRGKDERPRVRDLETGVQRLALWQEHPRVLRGRPK